MKKDNVYFWISCIFSFCLSGCGFITNTMTGMKRQTHLEYAQIDKIMRHIHLPEENTYVLDHSFLNFYEQVVQYNEQVAHDHLQPLQINVYNSKGELVSFHLNCFTKGLVNMQWNVDHRFDVFPPETAVPLDSTMNASRHLSMILNYKTNSRLSDYPAKYDYLFIVHWSEFLERQSKRLARFVEKYKAAYSQYKIKIIYVNDDNIYN